MGYLIDKCKSTVVPFITRTSVLLWFLFIVTLVIFIVGVLGHMFIEGHTFGKSVGRTCIIIADRERDHEKIEHEVFGPVFYLVVTVLNAIIIGIIGAEVIKRFFVTCNTSTPPDSNKEIVSMKNDISEIKKILKQHQQ